MKWLNNLGHWCEEHAFVWPWENGKHKESNMHIIAIWIVFIGTCIVAILNRNRQYPSLVEYWFYSVCGLASLFPPIYAAFKALFTRKPWEPWFWFNWVVAAIVGIGFGILFALCIGYQF